MDVNKGSVMIDKRAGSANMQLMSEGEITLAEGKPDIATLLKCDCSFVTEEGKVTEGRVTFKGRLKLKGMYLSDNKSVHSFSHEVPVNDFVNIEGAKEGMCTYIDCQPVSCDCKAANERKLIYKVISDVNVALREQKDCEYVEGLEGIPENQQRLTDLTTESMPVCKEDKFTIRDSLTLPMGKPNVEEMLDCDIRLTSVDWKSDEDSVRIMGDLSVSLIYKGEGETNPMELYEGTIPFKGELEAQGLNNSMLCDVKLCLWDSLVSIQPDEDGEMRVLDVEAIISAYITAREQKEIKVLEDVYILNKDTKLTVNNVQGSVCAAKNTSQCPVKEVVALDEKAPDMLQIYKAEGRPYVDFVQIDKGQMEIEGAVAVNILYVTGEDSIPVYCYSGVVPFKHTAQATGAREGMDYSVSAQLEHIGFNMLSDREVEVRCVINICAMAEDTKQYSFVSDVELTDIDKDYLNSLSSITLYVVRKGDTLWKLAKKFNTTVDDIVKINDIDNPDLIYPGQRLIIVKRIA